jgi:DNA-binding response OmpR family regulator
MSQNRPSSNQILIIEDDRNTATLVSTYLERDGFSTLISGDGEEGLETALRTSPLLVILDVMLPKLDGWEICRAIRRSSDVPILMLTAREEETDRVKGLAMGADDYVVKPFSPRELVERVKAILRRARPRRPTTPAFLSHDGLVLDSEKRKVLLNGTPVELTTAEFELLHAMMNSPGRAFSRDELLACIYRHGESVVERVIDVHIGKLRQKLGDDPSSPRLILTVRGYGYRFADDGDSRFPSGN